MIDNKKAASRTASDLPKLSAPAHRALDAAGITSLQQLTTYTEDEILKLHGMGPNAMGKLRAALDDRGLSFAASKKK